MACDFGGLGFINFDFLAVSAAIVHVKGYPKLLQKQMRVHPSRWQEEERPPDLRLDEALDIPLVPFSSNNQPSCLSPRPCLEIIDEQECQIDQRNHTAGVNFKCSPFRLCGFGGRICK